MVVIEDASSRGEEGKGGGRWWVWEMGMRIS